MDRRTFLTGTGLLLSAKGKWLGAATVVSEGLGNSLDVSYVGKPVNLFRCGEIQSWLQPVATSLLRSRLLAGSGAVSAGELSPGGAEADIGVEWPEFRTVHSVSIHFAGRPPGRAQRVIEIWDGITGLQGNWKPIQPGSVYDLEGAYGETLESGIWTIEFPPLRTPKVRLRIQGDEQAAVSAIEIFGPSKWKSGAVRIEFGPEVTEACDGHLEIYNGELIALKTAKGTSADGVYGWKASAGDGGGVAAIEVQLLYASGLDVDRTILTLRTKRGDFSFVAREALEEQPIDIPGFGVFVRNAALNTDRSEYRGRHAGQLRVIEAVEKQPEQTLEQAYDHIDADRVVAFVGVDSNVHKFGIAPDGHVLVGYGNASFGRVIEPKFSIYFDSVELSTVFSQELPPHISIFRESHNKEQHLAEGWLPIVTTRWSTKSDVGFERTDFAVLPDYLQISDQEQLSGNELSALITSLKINNASPVAQTIHFYIKPWDGRFTYGPMPTDTPNAWQVTISSDTVIAIAGDAQYGICFVDTNGKGSLQAATSAGAARYSIQLAGGEQHEIRMVVPGHLLDPRQIAKLKGLPYEQLYQGTVKYWQALLNQGMQLELPDPHMQGLYNAQLQHTLCAMTKDQQRDEYYANTGEFHYGPIGSESSPIIQALDMRGMHHHAEKCLDAFLSTQGDGVPDGEYSSKEGGFYHYYPWYSINQGFVLWALAEHYFYSGNREWLRRVAPKIISGCEFIVEGRKLTKKQLPDGSRPIYYGFAPAGTIGDPRSWKYSFMLSGFFYLGLKKCAQALEEVEPEAARRFAAEAADFLGDIKRGVKESTARSPVVRLRDGTSVPCAPSFVTSRGFTSDAKDNRDPDPRFSYASDCTVGALQLVKCEVLGPNDMDTTWLLNTLEDRFFTFVPGPESRIRFDDITTDWFDIGGFDKMQAYYLDNAGAYLQRDEIKQFLRAFFNTLAAQADRQNLSFQEETGSAPGVPQKTHEEARFLQQLRVMLVMELQGDVFLARGTPRSWLESGKHISVSRAPSYYGPLSYRIDSFADQGRIEATVQPPSRKRPAHLYLRLRLRWILKSKDSPRGQDTT